jgi:hypothetical protein
MASGGDEPDGLLGGGMAGFKSSDFGLNEVRQLREIRVIGC